jgi:hypothetical protein
LDLSGRLRMRPERKMVPRRGLSHKSIKALKVNDFPIKRSCRCTSLLYELEQGFCDVSPE